MTDQNSTTWTVSSSNSTNLSNANSSSGNTISIGNGVYTTGVCTCGNNCGGTLCGSSGGNVWPTTYQPLGTGLGTIGTGTGYYQPSNITFQTISCPGQKYSVMDLPRKDMPLAVYVCGRMVTFGILGTDVECAYVGDYLVFSPGIINYVWNSRTTIIIDYKDETYHYNIGQSGVDMYEKESPKLNATLVSTIKK